ncbi:hypothetical protein [Mucilaginibacter sp. L3T2-6]|nr:hypothetical protein [Mucilaginibacter sp. L3T2-6]MDO3645095.1 hypothetical protein [Mucilaginibacter sp. L3T2-6]MDV6217547.1 hypothetical protein [Mucilaginibacter sp. L3T2-6]
MKANHNASIANMPLTAQPPASLNPIAANTGCFAGFGAGRD